jgi:ornithine--oxo-acid transaminase
MSLIGTSEFASTFGNTPLGCAATHATLDLIDEPGYMARDPYLGKWFQDLADKWKIEFPFILDAVSCGTDMALYIDESIPEKVTGRKIAALCNLKGLLVTSFTNKVRMSPPLVVSDEEMERAMGILREALEEVGEYENVPGMVWTGPE